MIITVDYGDKKQEYVVNENIRASEFIKKEGVFFSMPCGGYGRCLNCKIVIRGELSEPAGCERNIFTKKELEEGHRLACYTVIKGDAVIFAEKKNEKVMTDFEIGAFAENRLAGQNEFGVSFDIGTTTVCGYLYNLSTGKMLAKSADKNAQVIFGGDVISRIESSLSGQGGELKSLISNQIGKIINEMCLSAGISSEKIKKAVITGNTAMLYFLTGKSPASISKAPFISETLFGGNYYDFSEDLLIEPLKNCKNIYIPKSIGAYVGADITCAEIFTKLSEQKGNAVLADIGTNGEIVLKAGDRLSCCAAAAGPAFEGSGLSCGVTAKEGAISRVYRENGEFKWETIGNAPAVGFCGSGIIDAIACMLEAGIIDMTGRIEDEYITEHAGEDCVKMCGFYISQRDIRSIQMGKAAICAGIETLVKDANITCEDIDTLLIAGGFGNYINVNSAEKIGLIPRGFAKKSKCVGNAAAGGASILLLEDIDGNIDGNIDGDREKQDEKYAKKNEVVELTTNPGFSEMYIEKIMFDIE